MPAKNAIKIYIENSFYHVYNRGINKMPIFLDEQDYKIFIYYMDLYLSPKQETIEKIKKDNYLTEEEKNIKISKLLFLNNFFGKIEILCYVLMPNHFHFILKQINKKDMELFLRSIMTKYTQYFNKKYDRVGHLYQGRYKAILIEKEEYLLHLSRYIHLNPKEILLVKQDLLRYKWSSYFFYVYKTGPKWINKDYILSYFKQSKGYGFSSYQGFVEGYDENEKQKDEIIKRLLID
jgi:putative transposase